MRDILQTSIGFEVISVGYKVLVNNIVPDAYIFRYSTESEAIIPGVIPADFCSRVRIDSAELFLNIRRGLSGPQYKLSFPSRTNVLVDWMDDLDNLWITGLQQVEDFGDAFNIRESDLQLLDADPLVIFGVATVETQRLVEEKGDNSSVILMCAAGGPSVSECFAYLKADPVTDGKFSWLIESFRETVLPYPWRSERDEGSFIVYMNSESGFVTLRHPFYDYFCQLLDYCRRASHEEYVRLRLTRMFWKYQESSASNTVSQGPLVSPNYVTAVADIFEVDISVYHSLVAYFKDLLKILAKSYTARGDISVSEINDLIAGVSDILQASSVSETSKLVQMNCSRCSLQGTCFCLNCCDTFCDNCFPPLHRFGSRSAHQMNRFITCSFCKSSPSIVQCSYSFAFFCEPCYNNHHSGSLPAFLEVKPIVLDYCRGSKSATESIALFPSNGSKTEVWHSFNDASGVEYFYNFTSKESSRRPRIGVSAILLSQSEIIHRISMSDKHKTLPNTLEI